jgi:hypothetical protein
MEGANHGDTNALPPYLVLFRELQIIYIDFSGIWSNIILSTNMY